jgi:hypothetical protein
MVLNSKEVGGQELARREIRKPYTRPKISIYGDLTDLTLTLDGTTMGDNTSSGNNKT